MDQTFTLNPYYIYPPINGELVWDQDVQHLIGSTYTHLQIHAGQLSAHITVMVHTSLMQYNIKLQRFIFTDGRSPPVLPNDMALITMSMAACIHSYNVQLCSSENIINPHKPDLHSKTLILMICNYGVTANNQLTANSKNKRMSSLGSQTESIIASQDLTLYQCSHLVSCL